MEKKGKYNDNSSKMWVRVLSCFLGALMVFGIVVMVVSSFLTDSYAAPEDSGEFEVKSTQISVGLGYLSSAVRGYTLSGNKALTLSIDGLTVNDAPGDLTVALDGNEYEYDGEITDNTNGVLIAGGYHVRISSLQTTSGGSSSDKDNPVFIVPGVADGGGTVISNFTKSNINEYITSINRSEALSRLQVYAFPTYRRNKCYISVGDYATKEEAEELLASLRQYFVMNAEVVGPSNDMLTVHTVDRRILFETNDSSHLIVKATDGSPLSNSRGEKFYGSFEFSRGKIGEKDTLCVVNTLEADDYVKSIMSSELSASYSEQMLAASAAIFRTLAYKMQGVHENDGFDVCDSSHCQKYLGCASVSEKISNAVDEVSKMVLTYKNDLIYPAFTISSGSTTVSSLEAIGNEYAYLQSLKTPWEGEKTPFDEWKTSVSPTELYHTLCYAGYEELKASVRSVTVDKRSEDSLYISQITFTDILDNTLTISGSENIKNALNGVVDSAAFIVGKSGSNVEFEYYDQSGNIKKETRTLQGVVGNFVFSGEGTGFGIGMSFDGAEKLAQQGKSCFDIINSYYPGAILSQIKTK